MPKTMRHELSEDVKRSRKKSINMYAERWVEMQDKTMKQKHGEVKKMIAEAKLLLPWITRDMIVSKGLRIMKKKYILSQITSEHPIFSTTSTTSVARGRTKTPRKRRQRENLAVYDPGKKERFAVDAHTVNDTVDNTVDNKDNKRQESFSNMPIFACAKVYHPWFASLPLDDENANVRLLGRIALVPRPSEDRHDFILQWTKSSKERYEEMYINGNDFVDDEERKEAQIVTKCEGNERNKRLLREAMIEADKLDQEELRAAVIEMDNSYGWHRAPPKKSRSRKKTPPKKRATKTAKKDTKKAARPSRKRGRPRKVVVEEEDDDDGTESEYKESPSSKKTLFKNRATETAGKDTKKAARPSRKRGRPRKVVVKEEDDDDGTESEDEEDDPGEKEDEKLKTSTPR